MPVSLRRWGARVGKRVGASRAAGRTKSTSPDTHVYHREKTHFPSLMRSHELPEKSAMKATSCD